MRLIPAILLLAAAMALSACDEDDATKNFGSQSKTASKSGATGAGATARRRAERHGSETGSFRRRGDRRAGRTVSGAKKRAGTPARTKRKGKTKPATKPTGKPGTYAIAKKVCGSFLLDTFVKKHKKTKTARQYSRAWPAHDRRAAYKGCLVGLHQSRPRSAGG
jgi:hypothetical protein